MLQQKIVAFKMATSFSALKILFFTFLGSLNHLVSI